jgi:EamA-like transporter family.
MVFAFVGIFIMFKSSIGSNDYIGNILAFGCALSFSFFILIIRKFRHIDMMPSSLIGGIFIVIVSYAFKYGDINISLHDILFCILWGALLNGFLNSVFIFSTKHLYASEVSFFMLIEFSLGPFWVWLFLDELLRNETLLGGIIIISSLVLFSLLQIKKIRTNSKLF